MDGKGEIEMYDYVMPVDLRIRRASLGGRWDREFNMYQEEQDMLRKKTRKKRSTVSQSKKARLAVRGR